MRNGEIGVGANIIRIGIPPFEEGGVGETTVAVNLAYALSKIGKRVGLLDADITGPNVSKMVGTSGPFREWEGQIVPHQKEGVKVVFIDLAHQLESP